MTDEKSPIFRKFLKCDAHNVNLDKYLRCEQCENQHRDMISDAQAKGIFVTTTALNSLRPYYAKLFGLKMETSGNIFLWLYRSRFV